MGTNFFEECPERLLFPQGIEHNGHKQRLIDYGDK